MNWPAINYAARGLPALADGCLPSHHCWRRTLAFVAPTNQGRALKVAFIFIDGNVHIKTAFDASPEDIAFYEKHGK